MSTSVRHQAIVLVAALVVMFTNLGGPRLWDRDEPRNAGCAAEMLERNDWVVPVFNGELRTHKPVLLYWLMMSAYTLFGVGEFAARFWSAALGVGTVTMTYHMARRLFDERAALWAGLSLATALMFGVASRAATPDAVLIFFSTLAIFCYVMLCGGRRRISWRYAPLIYAAMGMAILAKGPVGLVLPTAVIGMYLLIMRLPPGNEDSDGWLSWVYAVLQPFAPVHFVRTCLAMRPMLAVAVALAIALPWYVWVHYRTEGAWTAGFFLEHNLSRATQSMEGHRGNVLFYPAALAVGFFPWSIFLAPMIIDTVQQLRRGSNWKPGYIFALCWVGVYVVLFSLAKTKLPSYITPCYPGAALLMGAFVCRLTQAEFTFSRRWLQLAAAASIVVGLGLAITLPILSYRFLPGEEWLGALGLIPLAAGVVGLVLIAREAYGKLAASYSIAAVAFSTVLLALVPQRIDHHQQNDVLLAAIYQQCAEPQIGHMKYLEPTWVFYGGQSLTNVTTADDPHLVTSEVAPTDQPRQWQPRRKAMLNEFLASGDDRFVITTRRTWVNAQAQAPAGVEVLAEVPYFFKKESLVVVGRRRSDAPHIAELPPRLRR